MLNPPPVRILPTQGLAEHEFPVHWVRRHIFRDALNDISQKLCLGVVSVFFGVFLCEFPNITFKLVQHLSKKLEVK